jgi:hypothetical protein
LDPSDSFASETATRRIQNFKRSGIETVINLLQLSAL